MYLANGLSIVESLRVGPLPMLAQPSSIVARWGSSNAAGQADFDTGLYPTAATPADGVYAASFSVTAGVISLLQNPGPGIYDVGGVTAEVLTDAHAIGSQSEYDALTANNVLGSNKMIVVREGAAISDTGGGLLMSRGDKKHTRVLGDGNPRSDTSPATTHRRHFTRLNGGDIRNLHLENLKIEVTSPGQVPLAYAEASGSADIHVEKCAIIAGHPLPNGDYSAGFPFGNCVYQNQNVAGVTFLNCALKGGNYGMQVNSTRWLDIIGCSLDLMYADFIQEFGGVANDDDDTWLVAGCMLSRPLSVSSDSGGPHSDYVQLQSPATGRVFEFVVMQDGNSRGAGQAQTLFGSTMGSVQQLKVRGMAMICANTASGLSLSSTNGSVFEHCLDFPHGNSTLPMISDMRFGNASAIGANTLRDTIAVIGGQVSAQVSQIGNVNTSSWGQAEWDAAFPNRTFYDTTQAVLSQPEFLFASLPGNGSSAAGKGPGAIFSAGTTDELSDYICTAAAVPVLTNITTVSTTSGFSSCTVQVTNSGDPVFWAVVPFGQSISSVDEVKKRRISSAFAYGTKPVPDGATTIDLGAVSGLPGSSQFDLVMVQWDGLTQCSGIVRHSFTTL